MTTIPVEKATLSVAEMATLVGICVNTAYTYLEDGTIPARKLGKKKWIISKDKIIRWMEDCKGNHKPGDPGWMK